MRNVALLSALALSLLSLSACTGAVTRTPDPETAKALPAPITQVPAPFELHVEATVLERSGLVATLDGRTLNLTATVPVVYRLVRADGTYLRYGEGGKSLAPGGLDPLTVELGLVVEVSQYGWQKAVTVALKPRPAPGTGTVTPAQ